MIKIDLPKPISTNRLFRNKRRGRACTEEYNTWKWHAKALIQRQKPLPKLNGPVRILFAVGEVGLRKDMDWDNCVKCLQDALVDNGVIPDDKRSVVRSGGVEWVPGKEGATAYISAADSPLAEIELRGTIG